MISLSFHVWLFETLKYHLIREAGVLPNFTNIVFCIHCNQKLLQATHTLAKCQSVQVTYGSFCTLFKCYHLLHPMLAQKNHLSVIWGDHWCCFLNHESFHARSPVGSSEQEHARVRCECAKVGYSSSITKCIIQDVSSNMYQEYKGGLHWVKCDSVIGPIFICM